MDRLSSMEPIGDIINKRAIPGVLIIDPDNKVLHSNHEALAIIPAIQDHACEAPRFCLPDEIKSLCDRLKSTEPSVNSLLNSRSPWGSNAPAEPAYSLRAFYVDPVGESRSRSIMVLMERIVQKHEVDFEKAKEEYGLSKREVEVLQLVCKGLSNREIGETMFICEYTVKDHIKKIMKRMKVKSRSEMIAALT